MDFNFEHLLSQKHFTQDVVNTVEMDMYGNTQTIADEMSCWTNTDSYLKDPSIEVCSFGRSSLTTSPLSMSSGSPEQEHIFSEHPYMFSSDRPETPLEAVKLEDMKGILFCNMS